MKIWDKMNKIFLIFISLLFLAGCAQKIVYQIDGKPISDNIVRAELIESNIIVKYMILEKFYEYEGGEKYISHNFLNIMSDEIYHISNESKLELNIYVFNPNKINYRIKNIFIIGDNKNVIHYYNGKLSRNDLNISLPIEKGEVIDVYFEILDYNNKMLYRSFNLKYLI